MVRSGSGRGVRLVARLLLVVALWLTLLAFAQALHGKESGASVKSIPSKQNVTTSAGDGDQTTALPPTTSTVKTSTLNPVASSTSGKTSSSTAAPPSGSPAGSSLELAKIKNSSPKQSSKESLEQVATSQRASFAEPPSLASSIHAQQEQAGRSSSQGSRSFQGNRWTHFGARLRPLAGSSPAGAPDQQAAAANAKSSLAANLDGRLPARTQDHAAARKLEPEEEEDETDSEALLYRMMQQQGFLLSPSWQEQPQSAGQPAGQQLRPSQQQQSPVARLQKAIMSEGDNGNAISSLGANQGRRVIKLLKSYSHIHQVDDSDDQIRGSHQRINPSRAQQSGQQKENKRRQQANSHNRQPGNRPSQGEHIFVSSRPLAGAFSKNRPAQQRPRPEESEDNYYSPAATASGEQEGSGEPDGGQGGEEDEFECPNNGIFADEPSGCQAYHVCQSGAQVQQKFQCPLGTLFNNIILTCDFAHNVQCGGKNKLPLGGGKPEAHPVASAAEEPVYKQGPPNPSRFAPEQTALASGTGRRQSQQQQPWRPPVEGSGPRQLSIGQQASQYNRHQAGGSSQARALNSYPQRQAIEAGRAGEEQPDEEEPEQPLVPATLPPRAMAHPRQQMPPQNQPRQQSLPYREPPRPHGRQHSANYQQYSSTPAYTPPAFTGSYDGASAMTPVFAAREESTTPVAAPARSQPAPELEQQLNLVINHVAGPAADGKQPGHNNMKQVNHAPNFRQSLPAESTLNSKPLSGPRPNLKQQASASNSQQQQRQLISAPPHAHAHPQPQQRPQRAGQPAKAASSPQQSQQLPARPALVDLTNEQRKSAGVSSEALNDGLLLVVRHQSAPAKQAGRGQAFAVEPSVVDASSPLDAQLFPNVQRAIAAAQSQPVVSHHHHQQVVGQARVSAPLPPMAPPKPTLERPENRREPELLPVTEPAEATPTVLLQRAASQAEPRQSAPARSADHKRVKRTKRLKGSRTPPPPPPPASQLQPEPAKELSSGSLIESRSSLIVHQEQPRPAN